MNGQRSVNDSESTASQQLDETCLIEQAKHGNRQAISELYRRHVDTVYRFIYARVPDATFAEDLTSQVFLKALEGLACYQPSGRPFIAWLCRIAYARTGDYWRQQGRRQEVPLPDTLPASNPLPEDLIIAEAEWSTAFDLLSQLTESQQDVIMLRFLGDLKLADVAHILGKSVGAIKALQHRALASLARLLEEQSIRE